MFIQTKVSTLVRLALCANTDPTRYYIGGVHVRTKRLVPGVIVEATNGHILAIEHDAEGATNASTGDHAIVSSEAIKAIAAAAKALAKAWKYDADDMRVTINDASYQLRCGEAESAETSFPPPMRSPFIDGTFPDVERVIPRVTGDKPQVRDCYNPEYVATLARSAFTPSKKDGTRPCSIIAESVGTAAIMRVSGCDNWLGVLMPFAHFDVEARPAWLFPRPAMACAAE